MSLATFASGVEQMRQRREIITCRACGGIRSRNASYCLSCRQTAGEGGRGDPSSRCSEWRELPDGTMQRFKCNPNLLEVRDAS